MTKKAMNPDKEDVERLWQDFAKTGEKSQCLAHNGSDTFAVTTATRTTTTIAKHSFTHSYEYYRLSPFCCFSSSEIRSHV